MILECLPLWDYSAYDPILLNAKMVFPQEAGRIGLSVFPIPHLRSSGRWDMHR